MGKYVRYYFLLNIFLFINCSSKELPSDNKVVINLPQSKSITFMPSPPIGKRWVLDDDVSDEFNESKLNTIKWNQRYLNGWNGRPPGYYDINSSKVENGYLVLECSRKPDTIINGNKYNVNCGIVSSKKRGGFGYYECRFKPHKTSLSAAIWLMYDDIPIVIQPGVNQPSDFINGKFKQELDILETVGRKSNSNDGFVQSNGKVTTNWNWLNSFSDGMNYCAHGWIIPDGKTNQIDYKIKHNESMKPGDGSILSDNFNIYAMLWDNKDEVEFFFNGEKSGKKKFIAEANSKLGIINDTQYWLTEKMNIVLDIETYDWGIPPTDEELSNPNKNKSLYDYIRHYVLVDVNKSDVSNEVNVAPMQMLENHVFITNKYEEIKSFQNKQDFNNDYISVKLDYVSSNDKIINIYILNEKGEKLISKEIKAYAGFGARNIELNVDVLKKNHKYYCVTYLIDNNEKNISTLNEGDSFKFTLK